jgi:hypothetical protein
LFHAAEIQRRIARDALRHLPNESFGDLALSRRVLGIMRDQQIKDRRIGDLLGEIVGVCEPAARIAVEPLEPFEMFDLRRPRGVVCREAWPAGRSRLGLGDQERLPMVEGEPRLPLRVGKADAALERFAERRQFTLKVGMFGHERALLAHICGSAAHVADQMHDRVAMGDMDVKLVEGVAAEVLELLLDLNGDIVPIEIVAKLIPIGSELVGNGRKKDADRHGAPVRSRSGATLPQFRPRNTPHQAGACYVQRRQRRSRRRDVGDAEIRAALDRHWAASDADDFEAEHEIYQEDAVLEYPQSGERIRGRRNIQASRTVQPNKKRFSVRRIIGAGGLWVTEFVLTYDGRPSYTVSIMEFRDGKVARETQYFGDPFEPGPSRAHLVERMG